MKDLLVKQEKYLEAGIHIGTRLKLADMNDFVYRVRNDGLYILDLKKIDERIRIAGKQIARYKPEEVVVVASRTYSSASASKFCEITGCKMVKGRFIPGILTNVARQDFIEPKLLVICDPKGERQAVQEAGVMGIPTIALCDTDNTTSFIDLVVPCNNKGRRALALMFYLFTREYLMGTAKLSSYDEFTHTIEEFEGAAPEEGEEGGPEAGDRRAGEAAERASRPRPKNVIRKKEEPAEAAAEGEKEEAAEEASEAEVEEAAEEK